MILMLLLMFSISFHKAVLTRKGLKETYLRIEYETDLEIRLEIQTVRRTRAYIEKRRESRK